MGEFLFFDDDWIKFYLRVTGEQDTISPRKEEKINPRFVEYAVIHKNDHSFIYKYEDSFSSKRT